MSDHIISLIENAPVASLSPSDLITIRRHTDDCVDCRQAFEAAQISMLLLRERAAETFEPSPFFHTKVLASLRERQTSGGQWAWSRVWGAAGALASSMVLTVAALAALTFIPTAEYRGAMRFSNVSGFTTTSIIGKRLIYSPERLTNLNFGYSHPKGIDALLEYVYVSQQYGDDLNTGAPTANGQRGLLPGYGVWNATLNYRIGGFDHFVPTVFITTKNLADDTFIVDRRRGIMPGIPRLIQAGVKFSF